MLNRPHRISRSPWRTKFVPVTSGFFGTGRIAAELDIGGNRGLARQDGHEPDADRGSHPQNRPRSPVTAGPLPRVDGDGTSKSAGSRRIVALSQHRLENWLASDISKLDLLVIQIDGLHVAVPHCACDCRLVLQNLPNGQLPLRANSCHSRLAPCCAAHRQSLCRSRHRTLC